MAADLLNAASDLPAESISSQRLGKQGFFGRRQSVGDLKLLKTGIAVCFDRKGADRPQFDHASCRDIDQHERRAFNAKLAQYRMWNCKLS